MSQMKAKKQGEMSMKRIHIQVLIWKYVYKMEAGIDLDHNDDDSSDKKEEIFYAVIDGYWFMN